MGAILVSTLQEWPAWILITIGFYVSYRVLKFPDLTVDASFVAGTVATACAALSWGSSLAGLALAIVLSSIAGLATSIVYLTNPRPSYKLLSGVLVIFAFYSINYRVLSHRTSAGFSNIRTSFNMLADYEASLGLNPYRLLTMGFCIIVVVVVVASLSWFLNTRYGVVIRTIGSRKQLISYDRWRTGMYLSSGLIISNLIVGIGGWLYASINSYATINVFGTIIHALAAAIIGEAIYERLPLGKDRRISMKSIIVAPILGVTIYQFVKSFVAWAVIRESQSVSKTDISFNSQDQNTFIAILLVISIIAIRYIMMSRKYEQDDEGEL